MESDSEGGAEPIGVPGVAPGTVLADRYEIVRVLGQGGMGAVYEAVHRTIKKRVAVKLLRPEVSTVPSIVQRFLQEARTANEVRHKNIVEVTDFGVDGAKPFLVMEYLEGEPLTNWLERNSPAPVGPLLALLLPVGRALDYAHTKGFIHRDVKPDNVFVAKLPGERSLVPKVLDFGIAKNTLDPDVRLTSTQASMGTPLYMAPEQAGGAKDVTQAADQYAFAAMLYEALAGRPPHVAETYNGLIIAKVTADPESLVALRPELPEALAKVVERALSRDPKARFESMEALCAALDPFVGDAGASASREPRGPSVPVALAVTADASAASPNHGNANVTASGGTPSRSSLELDATIAPTSAAPSSSKLPEVTGTVENKPTQSKPVAKSELASTEAPHEVPLPSARIEPARPTQGPPVALVAAVAAVVAALGVGLVARSKSGGAPAGPANERPSTRPAPTTTAPTATSATIMFAFSPMEAEILLDDRVIGHGATRIDLPIDGRAHSLRVRAAGYLDYQEASFVVTGPRAIAQQLVRDPASVAQTPQDAGVASGPSAARPSGRPRNNSIHNDNGRLRVIGVNPLLQSRPR
ncbi:MAG: protein kinase [Myxococcales bacterium]|nr:protein kinase [Myxococcales bacterium]